METDKEKRLCEVVLVRGIQKKLLNVLFSCQNVDSQEINDFVKKSFQILNSKSAEVLVYTQVLLKIKDELAFAKLDLQRVNGDEETKEFKRVKWLESRMHYLSVLCHRKCFQLEVNLSGEVIHLVQKDIPLGLRSLFHQTTKDSLFKSCKCNIPVTVDDEKSFQQMQMLINKVISDGVNVESCQLSQVDVCIENECKENVAVEETNTEDPKTFSHFQETALQNLVTKLQIMYVDNETKVVPKATKTTTKTTTATTTAKNLNKEKSGATNKDKETPAKQEKTTKHETVSFFPAIKSKTPLGATRGSSEIFLDLPRITDDTPVKKEVKDVYPRSPSIWCDKNPYVIQQQANNLVKDRDIATRNSRSSYSVSHQLTNNQLPQANETPQNLPKSTIKRAAVRVKAVNKLKKYFGANPTEETGIESYKDDRLQRLHGEHGLKSSNPNIAIDAAKSIGVLGDERQDIIDTLQQLVIDETNVWRLRFEAAKSLLLLGHWQDDALLFLSSVLQSGNYQLKMDVMENTRKSKNAQFLMKTSPPVVSFCNALKSLVQQDGVNFRLRVEGALCLAHVCVKDDKVKEILLQTLQQADEKLKALALTALVKQLNIKDASVIDALMYQLQNARCWKVRMEAAKLFQNLDLNHIKESGHTNIFESLQKLLWNHPSQFPFIIDHIKATVIKMHSGIGD